MENSSVSNTKEHTGLFVLIMTMVFALSPLAIDMYLPALPSMANYFHSSIDAMEATVAVYLFGFAFGQLFFGAISDSLNKRHLMVFGLIGFSLSSIFIALSDTTGQLYFWRAVQAFTSGTSVVVFAMIHQKYGQDADGGTRRSSQVISYIMSAVVVAPMLAPIIGGQLLAHYSWQMIFYVLAMFSILALVITQFFQMGARKILPESQLKPLNIHQLAKGYKEIFSNSTTLSFILAGGFSFAGLFAFISGSPFVYMEYFNVSHEQFGWLVALNAIAMVSMNLINAKVLGHINPTRKLIFGGVLIFIVSLYLIIIALLNLGLVYVVAGVVMYVGCLGFTSANAIAGALASAKEYAGMMSGINGVLQFGIGALASTLVSISASTSALTMNAVMALSGSLCFIFVLVLFQKNRLSQNNLVNASSASNEPVVSYE